MMEYKVTYIREKYWIFTFYIFIIALEISFLSKNNILKQAL